MGFFGFTGAMEGFDHKTGTCYKISSDENGVMVKEFSEREFLAIAGRDSRKILTEPVLFDASLVSHRVQDAAIPMVVADENGEKELAFATWMSAHADKGGQEFARRSDDGKGFGVFQLSRRNLKKTYNTPEEALQALNE